MTTLTEFLLARIAEDEADAEWMHDASVDDLRALEFFGNARCECGRPARVLAECEAKRRIVGELIRANAALDGLLAYPESAERDASSTMMRVIVAQVEGILALLALPYADHPDYDEAWRP